MPLSPTTAREVVITLVATLRAQRFAAVLVLPGATLRCALGGAM